MVLACQRPPSARYPLKWEFPGGKLEPGESPRDALDRELREELGITVTDAREFHRQEWTYTEGTTQPEVDGMFRVHYFHVRAFTGEPANHVFASMRWIPPADLQALDMLEGNREAVALLSTREDVQ